MTQTLIITIVVPRTGPSCKFQLQKKDPKEKRDALVN
jgi:hypothetical protein